MKALERALDLNSDYAEAQAELGRIKIEVGLAREAIVHIERAIALSPTDSAALASWCLWAGQAAVHIGDYRAAVDWLERARQANRADANPVPWLAVALQHLGKIETTPEPGPVVVTVFDRERIADYQKMVATLRNAGIRAELYLGSGKMGPQLKYADKRGAPCVVIQGGDETAKGEGQIKDLIEGAKAAAAIASNQEWRASRPAQFAVPEDKLVDAVREVLARHDVKWS